MAKTRTYVPLTEAGRMRLPAAVLHPDDPLPKTWRLASTWQYRGQSGAWLVRKEAGLPVWAEDPKRFERRLPGRLSQYCNQPDAVQIVYRRSAPRRRTAHIGSALGKAGVEGTYSCDLEVVREEARRQAVRSFQAARASATISAQVQPPVQPASKVIPEPDLAPLSSPPAPGLDRARWLGEQITDLTGAIDSDLDTHARRRTAARLALARMAGYEPQRAKEDALYLSTASLHLASLNELARRVLDEGETDGVL